MIIAIILLVLLGILDVMLVIACGELEKQQEEWERKQTHDRDSKKTL